MSNLIYQAEREYQKRRPLRAAGLYKQVIEAEPDNAEAYVGLAACQNELRQYADAIENCNKALLLRPILPRAHITLAGTHFRQGQYTEAEEECQKALAMDRQSVANYLGLASLYVYVGKLIDAETVLFQALQVDPKCAGIHDLFRTIYNRLGMRDKAIQAARHTFLYAPNYRSFYFVINAYSRKYILFHLVAVTVSTVLGIFADPPWVWGGLYMAAYLMLGLSSVVIEELRKYIWIPLIGLIALLIFRIIVKGHFF